MQENRNFPLINNDIIRVTMLGSFTLCVGEQSVGDSENRSHQLWRVLEFLIAHRNRAISQNEIIDALWPENEIGNPLSALKNLIYRIRTLLRSAKLPHAEEMLLYHRDTYSWNNKLPTVVDCEEFEAAAKQAEDLTLSVEARIQKYLTAIQLYKGDFLPKSSCELWVIPLSTYYRELYIKSVHAATALLDSLCRYQEIISICEAATLIDQFDEGIHEALIRAYISIGEPKKAIAHYERVSSLFYTELTVKPSESLRSIYREIIKDTTHVETDLSVIKEDLTETNVNNNCGAYTCEYEVFKNVYRLVARSAERNGESVFVGLLTLSATPFQAVTQKYVNSGMPLLLDVICHSLRHGDVVSRFSPTQYILMLPTLTFENGKLVIERIIRRFKRENPRFPLDIAYLLQPIDPLWF